jgi:hydrogenase expression/formation protein HypC
MCLAAPARVLAVSGNVATVDYGGVETNCRLDTLTEEVTVGDYVLIHTGFAIRRLSPEDGTETLRLFDELAASLAADDTARSGLIEETERNPENPDSAVDGQSDLANAPQEHESDSPVGEPSNLARSTPVPPETQPSRPEGQKES